MTTAWEYGSEMWLRLPGPHVTPHTMPGMRRQLAPDMMAILVFRLLVALAPFFLWIRR